MSESEKMDFDIESCKIRNFERNKNFYGKLMTVADFDNEQKYFIGKIRLMNKYIHGSGIVCGCEVKKIQKDNSALKVEISQGYAIDCCGREIISSKDNVECIVELPDHISFDGPDSVGLWAIRKDIPKSPVPSAANNSTCDEVCCYSRIEEQFILQFDYVPKSKSQLELSFEKGLYKIEDLVNVHIKDESVDSDAVDIITTVMLKSNTDPTGISLKLEETGDKTHDFVGSFSLIEDSPSSEKKLLVNGSSGDDIILEYQDRKIYASVLSGNVEADKKRISNNYYKNQLRKCPDCDIGTEGPKVLLAIVDKKNESIVVDENETSVYRSIVCNNPMLCDILEEHLLDYDNPHKVTSEHVGALKTINGIGNTDKVTYIPNIDLVSLDGTIKILPEGNENRINLSASNSDKGILINSRSIEIPIKKGQYILSGPHKHRLNISDIDPTPLVLLAKEEKSGKIIQYTEDLSFLLAMAPMRLTTPDEKTRKWAQEMGLLKILDISQIEAGEIESQLFIFKPVHITKEDFHILIINNTQSDQVIRLRAWSISSVEPPS